MKERGNKSDRRVGDSPVKRIRMFCALGLVLLGFIVILQNTGPVETRVLFFSIEMPRAVFILGNTLVGFALGVLVAFYLVRKKP